MTQNDYNVIRGALKPFIAGGLISAGAIDEIKGLTVNDISNAQAQAGVTLSKWVTRKEAAKLLKVSVSSVIRYGKEGKISFKKLSEERLTRYKRSDIEAFENAE